MTGAGIAIDAHVHLHDEAGALPLLRTAAANLARSCPQATQAVVMLAERQGFHVFERLRPRLVPTGEPEAMWLDEDRGLLLLAGRQLVSAEGLEILGLATRLELPDGLPARDILAAYREADAILVLPWGVGKWLGRRGRLVDSLLERHPDLLLGDNGGRPRLWRVPRFGGRPLLSGSDPLPIAGSERAVGRFGSIVEGRLPPDMPAAALKALLRDSRTAIRPFGAPASLPRFLRDQSRLRLARRSPLAA